MFLTFSYRHVDRTYQDGLLVCVLQLGHQHPSLDTVIETRRLTIASAINDVL